MKKIKNIIVLYPSFERGGATANLINFVNACDKKKIKIYLITNITRNDHLIPTEISLDTVYPNPFNNSIRIDFSINQSGYVSMGIYDIMGRWITNIIGEYMKSGKHTINWNGIDISGNSVSSGLYILVLKSGNIFRTKKIKLLK